MRTKCQSWIHTFRFVHNLEKFVRSTRIDSKLSDFRGFFSTSRFVFGVGLMMSLWIHFICRTKRTRWLFLWKTATGHFQMFAFSSPLYFLWHLRHQLSSVCENARYANKTGRRFRRSNSHLFKAVFGFWWRPYELPFTKFENERKIVRVRRLSTRFKSDQMSPEIFFIRRYRLQASYVSRYPEK